MDQLNQQQLGVADAFVDAVVDVVDLDNDAPPEIFKLNVDCLDIIFDYLSLTDIHTMSQTCKAMRQLAGHYFQQHLPDAVGKVVRIGNFEHLYMKIYGIIGDIQDDFCQFFNKWEIECPVRKIMKAESFLALKSIEFWGSFNSTQLSYMKDVLINIENLDLRFIVMPDEILEEMINNCTKLKSLRLSTNNSRRVAIIQNWLQTNPTLRFLRIDESHMRHVEEIWLTPILKQNSNLKHLEITAQVLWLHKDSFVKEGIQLDSLIVRFLSYCSPSRKFADLLLELNEQGIYKKLYIHSFTEDLCPEFVNQVASLKVLQDVAVGNLNEGVDLSPLVHLKELHLSQILDPACTEIFAKNLINLERIFIFVASPEIILPFLHHSRKLKVIKFSIFDENTIIDLAALNKQRQQLNGARKVSICVNEQIYLGTKWATNNFNYNLVEIKRYESIDLDVSSNF